MSEFEVGAAVVASHPFTDGTVRGIIDTDGRFYTTDKSLQGISSSAFAAGNLRPLAVIDPENRAEAERLWFGWKTAGAYRRGGTDDDAIDSMQAALREFATPTPRIEEPTGLGAVVEAIHDNRFIRVGEAGWVHEQDASGIPCDWRDIAVVRVLSPGVGVDQ